MEKTNKTNSKNDLLSLLLHYAPYWPYFLISIIIGCGLAEIYLRYAIPSYRINASILISGTDRSNNNTFLSSMDVFSSKKLVENETAILESHILMDKVVKKLDLYAPIFLEGVVHNRSGYVESPVNLEAQSPDKLIIPSKPEKTYFSYEGTKVIMDGQDIPLNTWINSKWGTIRFIPNPNYIITPHKRRDPLYFYLFSVNQVSDGLIHNLGANTSDALSTVINLTLKDPVPKRGKDVLNTLIYFYNQLSLENKDTLAASTVTFLDQRLQQVGQSLDSIELAMQSYQANKGGVDLSEQSKLILGNASTNNQQLNEINVQLATLQQIKGALGNNTKGNPGIIPPPLGTGDDNVLSGYLTNLYNAELKYDQLRKTTAENNPILLSLKDQIDKIKPTILQYLNNKISTTELSKANLNNAEKQYASALQSIPEKQRELLEITRQQAIKSDLYNFLLKKREDAALSYAASISDTRIVDHAIVSPGPVSPKKEVVLGLGVILGLFFPFVFLALKEKIVSKSEVANILDYPILGEISQVHNKKTPIITNDSSNFITEQFRQIRTSLGTVLGVKPSQNKLLITSSISGEGKSFIASNLAVNLAFSGKKVLLIDLDLHRPELDKLFNEQGVGMSDFLSGQTTMDEIVYKTNAHESLFFVPSGRDVEEPSELLLNGKLAEFLHYMEGMYDYIVMDSAPINVISEGYQLSELCDATLFVVRYKVTPKSELRTVKENVPIRELKNAGIILNSIKSIKTKGYGKKYYGYRKKQKEKGSVAV